MKLSELQDAPHICCKNCCVTDQIIERKEDLPILFEKHSHPVNVSKETGYMQQEVFQKKFFAMQPSYKPFSSVQILACSTCKISYLLLPYSEVCVTHISEYYFILLQCPTEAYPENI